MQLRSPFLIALLLFSLTPVAQNAPVSCSIVEGVGIGGVRISMATGAGWQSMTSSDATS